MAKKVLLNECKPCDVDLTAMQNAMQKELQRVFSEMTAQVYLIKTGEELTNDSKRLSITFEPDWTINIDEETIGTLKPIRKENAYYVEFVPKTN